MAVGVLALGFIAAAGIGLTQVDLGAAAAALAAADPELLAAAIALYALGQTVSGAMWGVCQGAGGVRGLPVSTTLGMHWIARAACELMPASLGEAVRVALVRRHDAGAAAGAWRITGGIAGYKVVDAAVTGVAVLVIAAAAPLPGPAGSLRWTALIVVVGVAAAAVAWRMGGARRVLALVPSRARGAAARLGEGAGVLGDAAAARTAAVLGLLAVLARVLSLAALLAALGAPPQAAALAFAVIVLSGVIPGAPGGAGARELMLIPALALAYGIPTADALAFSLAVQAAALGTSLLVGAAALAWLGPGLLRRASATGATAPAQAVPEPIAGTGSPS
jgi:uncharacterized membrane protein YbhN (UPF0104 family)